MTVDDPAAFLDDTDAEKACLDYLLAEVEVDKQIAQEVMGDPAQHEAEPIMLAVLLSQGVLILGSHWYRTDWPEDARTGAALAVICNDVFAWGAADAVSIAKSDIPVIFEYWQKDREWGPAVWCIERRGCAPQPPVLEAIRRGGIWPIDAILASLESGPHHAQPPLEAAPETDTPSLDMSDAAILNDCALYDIGDLPEQHLSDICRALLRERQENTSERLEQARLLGASAERELVLRGELQSLRREAFRMKRQIENGSISTEKP